MRKNGSQIIFGHRYSFEILKKCTCIGVDQLCGICPPLNNKKVFEQSWWLHGLFESNEIQIQDENFPAFCVLMYSRN